MERSGMSQIDEIVMCWIEVGKELPKPWATVLCFCDSGNISTGKFYGKDECESSSYSLGRKGREYYGKEGRWFELAESGYIVTHWMPLPEPPEQAK
jgi:hypothetical protein